MAIKDHLKEYPVLYAAGAMALTLVGGSVVVELPADKKVAELEVQFAQTWQQQQTWQQAQQQYHRQREVEDIQFRMRYLANEINRLNQLPSYLNRPLSPQESWQIEQYKTEFSLLQQRIEQINQ